LLAFRRQVKGDKIALRFEGETIFTSRENLELAGHLAKLFAIVVDTSPVNPAYRLSRELEKQLSDGQGFREIYQLKGPVLNALHTFGCRDLDDREEIFHESLIVFWKKVREGEVGIYFSAESLNPEHCRVFSPAFYQNSKLSTYLTGIAKNIFLNKTRASDYQVSRNSIAESIEPDALNQVATEVETPALILFLFFRIMVENRKLRTLISLLQYDCNLEDKEVRQLIGINNARIHSCRLRNRFFEWYSGNICRIPELLDAAHDYLEGRELKKQTLNLKIRAIDMYCRDSQSSLDMSVFKEEFRTVTEFMQLHLLFKYVFYFSSVGKPSALNGLPDEKNLRTLMGIYKEKLFGLPQYRAILFLLYYGSDEPDYALVELMKGLGTELHELASTDGGAKELARQLQENAPENVSLFGDEMYKTNKALLVQLNGENDFLKMICENETVQATF
jgi:hypothetical protein